jgi:hypothetical protein
LPAPFYVTQDKGMWTVEYQGIKKYFFTKKAADRHAFYMCLYKRTEVTVRRWWVSYLWTIS